MRDANGQGGGDGPAIEFEEVTFSYPGAGEAAVERVSFEVGAGERLGILGPNGGGKTTLIKLMLGLLAPTSGRIRVCGSSPVEARTRGVVGYVPQRIEAELAFPLSARQVVEMGAGRSVGAFGRIPIDRRARVDESCEVTGVTGFADRHVGKLSGGQVQRVMIARALASSPSILVMDEPTVGVDPAGQLKFAKLLGEARDRFGLTIVIVSHDVKAIAAACDRVACLSRTLHSHTAPSGLTPDVLAEVFQHDVAAVFGDVHVHAHPAEDCTDPSHTHEPAGPERGGDVADD